MLSEPSSCQGGRRLPVNMLVHIPPERHHKPHKVIIRQLYKGREAGRITWVLLPSATGTDRTGFMRKAEACYSL